MKKTRSDKSRPYMLRVNNDNTNREQKRDSDIDAWDLGKQQSIRYDQDTEERKLLSHWVMWVVSVWLFLVLAAIVFNKFFCLGIEPSVSLMLLGTTTVNILGLAFIVLRGLFDDTKKPENSENRKR